MKNRRIIGAFPVLALLIAMHALPAEAQRSAPARSRSATPAETAPTPAAKTDEVVQLRQAAPTGFNNASIFATVSADLNAGARVLSGDLIVNNKNDGQVDEFGEPIAPLPTLSPGVELNIGIGARTPAGFATRADSIRVRLGAHVNGDLFCNELLGIGGNNLTCGAQTFPVFPEVPTASNQPPRPDAEDVTVGVNQTITLPEGDYGDIVVRRRGRINFTGGTYNIRSLDMRLNTRGAFFATSIVHVEEKFGVDAGGRVGPAADSNVTPGDVIFFVNGINGNNGNLQANPKAAKCGLNVRCHVNIYAPNGTLWLRAGSRNIGQFIAREVNVGVGARVSLDSFYKNRPPTADPQILLTDGVGDLEVILTGADPEGEDLTFSIVTPPTKGVLGPITPIVPAPIPEIDPETGQQTGNMIQPPIISASVSYSPNDPQALEEDSFTFAAADPEGLSGSAVITINPFDPSPPPPPVTEVSANDVSEDTPVDTPTSVGLDASGPEGAALTYRIESLPAGMLSDSDGTVITSAGTDLPTPMVTYTPPVGQSGLTDLFQYSARDSSTPATPCSAPSCATASASVNVEERFELAPDQQVTTNLNQPVEFLLKGNDGGSGTPTSGLAGEGPTVIRAAFPGASDARNVCDNDGDGLGEGIDNPVPLNIVAGLDIAGNACGTINFDARTYSGDSQTGTQAMTGNVDTFSTATITFDGVDSKPNAFGMFGLDLTTGETIEVTADYTTGPDQVFDIELGSGADPSGTYTSESSFLAQIDAGTDTFYDFEVASGFPDSATTQIGCIPTGPSPPGCAGSAFFDAFTGDNVGAPSPTQIMRAMGPGTPPTGTSTVHFDGLATQPNAIGFFAEDGANIIADEIVLTLTFTNESTQVINLSVGPTFEYFGFIDTSRELYSISFQGRTVTGADSTFGLDNMTIGTASGGSAPEFTPIYLGHVEAGDTIESLTIRGTELANRSASRAWSIDNLTVGSGSATADFSDQTAFQAALNAGADTYGFETSEGFPIADSGLLNRFSAEVIGDFPANEAATGVLRVQVEYDISSLAQLMPEDVQSATVLLNTVVGSVDELDTMFFVGDQDQDGAVTPSDYEAPATALPNVVMPVPPGAQSGQEGTFSFDVTGELKAALGQNVFSLQGRVDEQNQANSGKRGLQIRSSAAGNETSGKNPQLIVDTTVPPPPINLQYKILSIPSGATIKDLSGATISVGSTFTKPTQLVFTPPTGGSGNFLVTYEVIEGGIFDTGVIDILVSANDGCALVGRPPGCTPGL